MNDFKPCGGRTGGADQTGRALESVADREWGVFRGGQSIGRCKLLTNVATSIADHLGMIFEPEEEALFELATERVPDMGNRIRLEAGIHPEMERSAILNRSMPSTAGATISILASQERSMELILWSISLATKNVIDTF